MRLVKILTLLLAGAVVGLLSTQPVPTKAASVRPTYLECLNNLSDVDDPESAWNALAEGDRCVDGTLMANLFKNGDGTWLVYADGSESVAGIDCHTLGLGVGVGVMPGKGTIEVARYGLFGNGGINVGMPDPENPETRTLPDIVTAGRVVAGTIPVFAAASITLDIRTGETACWTATQNATVDAIGAQYSGQSLTVIIVNDSTPRTITFGAGFRAAGPLVGTAGKAATVTFKSNGGEFFEAGRVTGL